MGKFELGQEVVVVDTGAVFDAYEVMAEVMGLKHFEENASPKKGTTGKVVAIHTHLMWSATTCVAVHIEGGDYIFGEDGIEVCTVSEPVHKLKTDWSFGGAREQWNTVKALCIVLGYGNGYRDNNPDLWLFIATSNFSNDIVYTDFERTHHFTDLGKLVMFLLDDKAELKALLAQKIAEVKELEAQIAA